MFMSYVTEIDIMFKLLYETAPLANSGSSCNISHMSRPLAYGDSIKLII